MKKTVALILTLALPFLFLGCESTSESTSTESESTSKSSSASSSYEQIDASAAYSIMQSENDYIIIDARTQEEFDQGHIENAILIPEYEIAEKAGSILPDKDELILVYCRSGRRSKIAADELVKLGYTNVKEFGGIIDWTYETVK